MHWSSIIAVNIDKGENDKGERIEETTAHLLRHVTHYGDYGPMAEYESADGEKFWIDGEYMAGMRGQENHPHHPD